MDLENIQGSRNLGGGGLVFMAFVHISEGPCLGKSRQFCSDEATSYLQHTTLTT